MLDGIKIATCVLEDLPIPAVRGGAIESIVDQLSKAMSKPQWFIFSKFYPGVFEKDFQDKNIHYFYFNLTRKQRLGVVLKRLIPEWAVYPFWIGSLLKKINPDILVIQNEIPYLKYILKAFSAKETKIILYLHNDRMHEVAWMKKYKKYFRNVSAIICVSGYIASRVKKFVADFPVKNLYVLNNASLIKPIARLKNKSHSKKPVIIFVGRITRDKGAYLLLEALQYFKMKDFTLLMIGTSHHGKNYFEPEFIQLRDSLPEGQRKNLVLTGFVDKAKVKQYFDQADLAVFPSLWQDPAPLVLFEAWARGVPVLATRVGGIPELVDQFKHAELVSPKISPQKLATTIEKLLKNKAKLKNLSKKGLHFAKNYGNFKRMAKDFETILKAATAESDSLN